MHSPHRKQYCRALKFPSLLDGQALEQNVDFPVLWTLMCLPSNVRLFFSMAIRHMRISWRVIDKNETCPGWANDLPLWMVFVGYDRCSYKIILMDILPLTRDVKLWVAHAPRCMPESLTRGDGENAPGILARGPMHLDYEYTCYCTAFINMG